MQKSDDKRPHAHCGATTRNGERCRAPAMTNGRCRMHGGRSTGPRTEEGMARLRRARTRHGLRSAERVALRKAAHRFAQTTRQLHASLAIQRISPEQVTEQIEALNALQDAEQRWAAYTEALAAAE